MPTLIGFMLPLVLAAVVGVILHASIKPVSAPAVVGTDAAAIGTVSNATNTTNQLPSAGDIESANTAILNYCRNDLRQGTNCTLINNTDVTAPGFVESGVRMSGYFEGHNSSTDGVALAKGGGSSWSVLWVGQGCIPKSIAASNGVTQPLQVCQ